MASESDNNTNDLANASVATRHHARAVGAPDSGIARGFGGEAPMPTPGEPDEE